MPSSGGGLLDLVVERLDGAAALELDDVAPRAVRDGEPLVHDTARAAAHGHVIADFDASRRRVHQAIVAAALDRASPRSVREVNTIVPPPTSHMSVVSVSPGKTTPAKRTSNVFMRAGSLPQNADSTARPARPNEQRPWRIGTSKPPIFAKSGSAWSGFMSPERR